MLLKYMLSILFFQSITASGRPPLKGETHVLSEYVWDKLHFGTRWKVYIQVMTYDLLHSSFYRKAPLNDRSLPTLSDVMTNLLVIAANKHPCRRGIFLVFGRQSKGKFFVQAITLSTYFFAADHRICGGYSLTFIPGNFTDEPKFELRDGNIYRVGLDLKYVWHLQAGAGYGVNGTVSQFTAPPSHGCGDASVITTMYFHSDVFRHALCPNWDKYNFVATRAEITLLLKYYHRPLFTMDQQFTKLSAYYQIVSFIHRLFKLYRLPIISRKQHVDLGIPYTFGVSNSTDSFLNPNDSPLAYFGKSPNALVYAFNLNLDNYFTPVILRQNVSCNIPEAETIFYDGPLQVIWKTAVPILEYWKCSHTTNNTRGNSGLDEVRGSIGELTVVFLTHRRTSQAAVYLAIIWHAEPILSNVLRTRQISLDFPTTVETVHFPHSRRTFVDVVNVQAANGTFVHLGFSEIHYILHTEQNTNAYNLRCLDGFEIKDPMQFSFLGQICSNLTAEKFLKHYQLEGLTAGPNITIKRKQYAWLGTMSAVIIASVHSCAGYINVLPVDRMMFSTYRKPGATVHFDARNRRNEDGSFARYMDVRIRFKRSINECCKLQIVPFEFLAFYVFGNDKFKNLFIKYMITSEDLTSPSRFVIDLSSMGGALQFRNTSSSYGLRLYSLNIRLIKPTVPYTGVWDTDAYSAQLAFHPSILTRAAGFKLQVGDGTKAPVCTYERGTNVTAMFFDVHLLGPCAKAQVNTQELDSHFVTIYKTFENRRCCHFDGYITIDHAVRGMVLMFLYSPGDKTETWTRNMWNLTGSGTVLEFHVLCQIQCSTIFVQMSFDRNSSNEVNIAYLASLLDQMDLTGITFPQSQIDVENSRFSRTTWKHVCHNLHCYSTPISYMNLTWDAAQKACEEKQKTLVSINSDFEWALLTRLPQQEGEDFIELYNISNFALYYIGLITDVSTKH